MTVSRTRWTPPLDARLRELFAAGLSDAEIGAALGGRSVASIEGRQIILGLLRGPDKTPKVGECSDALSEHWEAFLAAQDDAFDVALTQAGIRFEDHAP